MKNMKKLLLLAIVVSVTSACASNPPKESLSTSAETDKPTLKKPESKEEELATFDQTTIETSNGTITIEPTVVSTTDEVIQQEQNSTILEVQVAEGEEYYDPFESINRAIFSFNHVTYKYFFIPIANGYNAAVPDPVQESVTNVFDNIREPLNLVNNVFSGEISEAGANLGRFLINSTVGLLGLFDPAEAWFDIQKQEQNVSQTLMKHDVGSGAYIVLPFFGQSDVRGTASIITESLVHPTKYIFNSPTDIAVRAADGTTDFASQADLYQTLYEQSDDPYIYFRNQYIQSVNRDALAEEASVSEVNATGKIKDE